MVRLCSFTVDSHGWRFGSKGVLQGAEPGGRARTCRDAILDVLAEARRPLSRRSVLAALRRRRAPYTDETIRTTLARLAGAGTIRGPGPGRHQGGGYRLRY